MIYLFAGRPQSARRPNHESVPLIERMSSDDFAPSPQPKASSSSFAGVLKNFAGGRPKSQAVAAPEETDTESTSQGRPSRTLSRSGLGPGRDSSRQSVSPNVLTSQSNEIDFAQVLRDLHQVQSVSLRIDAADTASRSLRWLTLDQASQLWNAGRDLTDENSSVEVRKAGSKLLGAICKRSDLPRTTRIALLADITKPAVSADLPSRLTSLIDLSDQGIHVDLTHERLLPTLSKWLESWYNTAASTRSSARSRSTIPFDDESLIDRLFKFIIEYVSVDQRELQVEDIADLLDQIFKICKKTTAEADIRYSIGVLNAITVHSAVPDSQLVPCLEVLSGTYASVKSLAESASDTIRSLLRSQQGEIVVVHLYEFLEDPSSEQSRNLNLNIIRGAVYIFKDLIVAHGEDGLPLVSFEALIGSLKSALPKDNARLEADILQLSACLFEGEKVVEDTLKHDWNNLLEIIRKCSERVVEGQDVSADSATRMTQSPPKPGKPADLNAVILAVILQLIASFESSWPLLSLAQKEVVRAYYIQNHKVLNESQFGLMMEYYSSERLCHPSHSDWAQNCWQVVQLFFQNRDQSTQPRISALKVISDSYLANDSASLFNSEGILKAIMGSLPVERDVCILVGIVAFLVEVAGVSDDETFKAVIDTLGTSIPNDVWTVPPSQLPLPSISRPGSSLSTPPTAFSMTDFVSRGLVRAFLRSLKLSSTRSTVAFEKLLEVAGSSCHPVIARLTVLKLLFRIRCDSEGSIQVISSSESESLAAALCRTVESMSNAKTAEDKVVESHSRVEDSAAGHSSRASQIQAQPSIARSTTRGASTQAHAGKRTAPLWMYPGPRDSGLPENPPSAPSAYAYAFANSSISQSSGWTSGFKAVLRINLWIETIISFLQQETDWELYSYVVVHLGSQLSNVDLFNGSIPQIKLLRNVLCEQIKHSSFHEPPFYTGLKKADVALCIFNAVTMLICYHEHFAKSEEDEIVRTFMQGIGSLDRTSRSCIHALSICCHEIPLSVTKSLNAVLDKMAKIFTQSHLAMHILEFLAGLARLPDVYINLRDEEIRTIFGICIRYLQTAREHRYPAVQPSAKASHESARQSGATREIASAQSGVDSSETTSSNDLPQYVYFLTYHVMVFWFLSLKLQDRANHVSWITKRLVRTDESGKDAIDDQSQVFIDFMQRTAYSDLGETVPNPQFADPADGAVTSKSWIVGRSIVTIDTAGTTGLTQITKRQASGTTHALYLPQTAELPTHHIPRTSDPRALSNDPSSLVAILPNHILLQMTTSAHPTLVTMQPIPLPEHDFVRRAITLFDRNDTVDGHKIGVIYIGRGQTLETQILANTSGSRDYDHFIAGLGTRVQLRGAKFNTQGLDSEVDGEYTYAWRDRVTEIVYHITTMMPTNLEQDPRCINKKRHVGNDFVNIIFNHSNLPFKFDTIPSQFNFVNIVISPASRIAFTKSQFDQTDKDTPNFDSHFYKVRVMSKSGFPEISPAAETKVISGKNLAAFVRLIALNASVFSLVWANRDGGEHISSWRNRFREINKLRDRVTEEPATEADAEGQSGGQRRTRASAYPENDRNDYFRAAARRNADSELTGMADNLVNYLDFSGWAG